MPMPGVLLSPTDIGRKQHRILATTHLLIAGPEYFLLV